DLFGHFQSLAAHSELPDLQTLENDVCKLHQRYTHAKSFEQAQQQCGPLKGPGEVLIGSEWKPRQGSHSTAKESTQSEKDFVGDGTLACSMLFMQDAIVARELAYSISEGDIGRAYECIKIMLFTFAGSTHTKYATYLLKMICNLELECSPELKDAILSNWLVNLEGLPSKFYGGDFMQEYYNDILQHS
ncbi:hypothetical protein SERLA73DRAFT_63629, partial [Serpula lacrymans var. lacrymans S7.3]